MTRVVGIRFRTAGKIYFFDPVNFDIKKGDNVIVETARGIEFGTAVSDIREVEDEKVVQPLKPVLRIANDWDREQEAANKIKEKEAYDICLEKIRKHELDMKLIDAEYTFDNNKVLFYFTADGRIDFRELVKDLASVFKTRIELRQIGVRDETKSLGGIGICGRVLCCHSYLSDFIPVSIKMAKEQNLSLNPTKISGVCGRLMCCLKHEEDTYEELNRKLPAVGDFVTTEDGLKGEVQSVNVLRQLVKVIVEVGDEKEIREYDTEKLKFKRKHGKKDRAESGREERQTEDLSREELRELEMLEKQEKLEKQDQDAARGDRSERPERGERPDRGERSDRSERPERGERTDRGERSERRDRNNRGNRQEREERSENLTVQESNAVPAGEETVSHTEVKEAAAVSDVPAQGETARNAADQGTAEGQEKRNDRNHRGNRNRGYRNNRGNRPEGAGSQEKSEGREKGDSQEHRENHQKYENGSRQDRNVRRDRRDRGEKNDREKRQERTDRQEGKPKHHDNRTENQ